MLLLKVSGSEIQITSMDSTSKWITERFQYFNFLLFKSKCQNWYIKCAHAKTGKIAKQNKNKDKSNSHSKQRVEVRT